MYQRFYGLSEAPFELTSNPRFVFYTARQRAALGRLENRLLKGSPLTLLLGDAGTGKTTLLQASLQSDRCRHIESVYLKNPVLTRDDLFATLLAHLEPRARTGSPAAALYTLREVLLERRSQGLLAALAIDEAESLSDERFEEVYTLSTMDGPHGQLLPIVLSGLQTLGARLDRPELARLKRRVALRCELEPLNLSDTASYILWRAQAAGAPGGSLFTREAIRCIHECSEGIPRTINVICDNALLSGFSRKLKPVTREIVADVCRQLDFGSPSLSEATPPVPKPQLRSTAAIV